MSLSHARFHWFKALTIATLITIAIPMPSRAADRIVGRFPPFKDISISVRDLETFAKQGKIPTKYAELAKQVPPAQLQQWRQVLTQRFDVSPTSVSQFTNSPLVEKLLDRIGESIQPASRQNGMKSLRTALISAAKDKKAGLTPINFIKQFPSRQINLDLAEVFIIYDNLTELFKRRDNTIAAFVGLASPLENRIANPEAANTKSDFTKRIDLRRRGSFRWQKRQFAWLDKSRQRMVPGDLYLPQTSSTAPIPIIAISHGVAEDRTTYGYLAEHLASYGFAVASIEHIGGDANRFRQYFSGLAPAPKATELLERPRDVSFFLDELQRQSSTDSTLRQVDVDRVGLVGHSLGGYTVLALAGAQIDFDLIKRSCTPNRSLNLSVLLQCRANELTPQPYRLQDPRIKAVFAISPLGSTLFGKQGMSQIRVPVFLLGGGEDIITPVVPEQIYPFTWLQTPNKYLAILDKGTHFSTQDISKSDNVFPVSESLIGADPAQAQIYTKALGAAFFETHLANQSQFKSYLNAGYANFLTQPSFQSANRGTNNLAALRSKPASLRLNLVDAAVSESLSQALQQDTSRAPKLVP